MRVRAHRGEVTRVREFSYVILGYVEMYPGGVHGYRLGRTLAQSPLGLFALRLGQVYRALRGLERAGLLQSEVEAGGARPARYRYTLTREGAEAFHRWVTHLGNGCGSVRERLLNRLRFVDRLSAPAIRSLLAEAVRECEVELQQVQCPATRGRRPGAGGGGRQGLLLQARIAADRHWLDELAGVVERLYGRDEGAAARQPAASAGPSTSAVA
jgi:DNA-binding PadR family transcriptional regulator